MFRRNVESLPADAPFTPDLKQLGYFFNDNGDLRMVRDPSRGFYYRINKVQRWNEVNAEAMHCCLRGELKSRFHQAGAGELYLPQLTTSRPPTREPSVPILIHAPEVLRAKKRVLVVINESMQDLGVWSWRFTDYDHGLLHGTASGLIQDLGNRKVQSGTADPNGNAETPGLVVCNLGQLLYTYKWDGAVTPRSWDRMPRKSAVHPAATAVPNHNYIPGNRTPEEHLRFVFEKVLLNTEFVSKDADIYVVGLGTGGDELVHLLDREWSTYSSRIAAIAFSAASLQPSWFTDDGFKTFATERARSWSASDAPKGSCIGKPSDPTKHQASATISEASSNMDGSDQIWGFGDDHNTFKQPTWCLEFSCGVECNGEDVFPHIYPDVMKWLFDEVAKSPQTYKNPEFEVYIPIEETEIETGRLDDAVVMPTEQDITNVLGPKGVNDGEEVKPSAGSHEVEFMRRSRPEDVLPADPKAAVEEVADKLKVQGVIDDETEKMT
ncbi:MAG: hypothetical protein M1820_003697 [Bogoriella megaspora]|nr:MAG: hypothetical protein M1820_003697 [Bogoriella megaspora]